jgi:predicted ATPase/DNA-binding SARP family transcriptional activator/Tfp pilus assembly protein PilF
VLNKISTLLPGCLHADRHSVQFQRAPAFWLDIDAFEHLEIQQDPDALATAVALYQGEFLEGLYLKDCPEFEIWVTGERERWRQRATQVLGELIAHHSQRGRYQESLRFARHLLALEPWREETHRQMMRMLARSGQRSAALAQYESCRRILANELGIEPLPETTALYERIQTATLARKPDLPAQPTRFVGREEDLAQIANLLNNPECRLLTILGPGGIGKTRLALQAAEDQTQAFLEGVFFIPLAPLSTGEHLTSAIAKAVGFSFSGRDAPQQQILNYLRGKEMLLILDSFEHLLKETEFVAEILREASEITLLITSREPLNLRWEYRLEIEGLHYPINETPSLKTLATYSAIQLFEQIAQRARPRFQISADNESTVVRICRLVEGLPLGIEMAAAWVRKQTCAEIADEIKDDLELFATSMRDVPERHRSLRATFEHSWRLLNTTEQHTFAALSVFRGGFQPEAAREIVKSPPDVLESLADKSLLRCPPSGRCEMHELLRQYAAEKLSSAPEVNTKARDRHCEFYAAFLEHQEANLVRAGPVEALAAIRTELANVRAAWNWAVQTARLEDIERGLASLSRYYLLAGPFQEGEMLIGRAVDCVRALVDQEKQAERKAGILLSRLLAEQTNLLDRQGLYEQTIAVAQAAIDRAQASQAIGPEVQARLTWGRALWCQGEYEAARSQLETGLDLARGTATQAGLQSESSAGSLLLAKVEILRSLGNVFACQGDYTRSRAYYEESLCASREIGDRQGEAGALCNLGNIVRMKGKYADAKAYEEQALHIYRELGDRVGESGMLNNLGLDAIHQSDYAGSEVYRKQALSISREIGDRSGESLSLQGLGLASQYLGNYATAKIYHEQALQIVREMGDRRLEGNQLMYLGGVAIDLGDYVGAMACYEQALQIHQEIGNRCSEGHVLIGLGLVYAYQGRSAQAKAYLEQAVCICRELGDRLYEERALSNLGYTLAESGRPAEAAEAYRQALSISQELSQPNQAMESLSGLAQVSLAQGDLPQAQSQAEEILTYLESNTLEGIDPHQVYLICYQVLKANDDPRAQRVLSEGYRLLQEQAAKISDEETRRAFLENVAAHREIVAAFESQNGSTP